MPVMCRNDESRYAGVAVREGNVGSSMRYVLSSKAMIVVRARGLAALARLE